MFRRADNKMFAAVGDNSLTSALPAAGTVITSANLPNGAIVITDLGLRRLDNSTAGSDLTAMGTAEQFLIVQGMGATKPLLKSEAITIGNATITAANHVINCQQVTTIGYDRAGATGSLPVANDTSYHIKVRKNDNDAGNRMQPASIFGQFKTDASGTQEELAFGLSAAVNKNVLDEPANRYLKAEVVGDGTVADFTGAGLTLKFTKGSKEVVPYLADLSTVSTVTVADNDIISIPSSGGKSFTFTAGADTHEITIGETLYDIADGGTIAQNGVLISAAINAGTQASASDDGAGVVTVIYKPGGENLPPVVYDDTNTVFIAVTIASGDANEVKYRVNGAVTLAAAFTLDAEYAGETGFVEGGTTAATHTGVATVTNYGVKLTGIQADFDVAAFRNYYANRFTATFSDEGVTLVTASQGARNGTGMWQQVALDEYMTWGYEGQNEMTSIPPKARETKVVENGEYSVINIEWTETVSGLVSNSAAKGSVIIYCELDGDSTLPVTNASGEVADVLGDIASPTFAVTALDK
jgi:hypothetical protein